LAYSQLRQFRLQLRPRSYRPVGSARSKTGYRSGWTPIAAGGVPLTVAPLLYDRHPPRTDEHRHEDRIVTYSSSNGSNTLWTRIKNVLAAWIGEPVLTTWRFAILFMLFFPVLLTSPLLLFGSDSNGSPSYLSICWYDWLTKQMQRAGPTFVKVRPFSPVIIV
jgi:hypothetical protein